MKQTDWTKRLHDQLADHEEAAPDGLWADIEAALAQQEAPKPAPARRIPLWGRWAAVAAVAAGLLVGPGYRLWQQRQVAPVAEGEAPVAQVKAEVSPQAVVAQAVTVTPSAGQTSATPSQPSLAQPSSAQLMAESQDDRNQPGESVDSLPEVFPPSESQPEALPLPELEKNEVVLAELDRQIAGQGHRSPGVAFDLYAANGFGTLQRSNGVLMSPNQLARYDYHSATRGEDNQVWLYNYEERQKHYQPVSFGLTVKIPISSVLSLSSGLVYTRLHSDFTNIANGYPIEQEQTLRYVGIPLSAQYRLWHVLGFDLYATAGGQMDVNVKARYVSSGTEVAVEKDRLQFSVQGALGVQYNFIPWLGIYAEPGVKYYFDNGSRVRNFFKDKPTNFNLQLGLRLNL